MHSFLRPTFTALLLAVSVVSAAAAASQRLFVFYGDRGLAEVRNPADGGLAATLATPRDAFQAFALPGRNDSPAASKIYVISPSEATIFNASHERIGSIAFGSIVAPGSGAAALSPDGARLLIAAGRTVTVIDTAADRVLATLDPGFAAAALAFSRDGLTAYVLGADAAVARGIDLSAATLSDRIIVTPARMEAWTVSPDGARALSVSGQGLYDPEVFDAPGFRIESGAAPRSLAGRRPGLPGGRPGGPAPRPPLSVTGRGVAGVAGAPGVGSSPLPTPRAATQLAVTNSGRYFLHRDGSLETGRLNQAESIRTIASGGAAGPWAVSRDGAALYRVAGAELRASDAETGAEGYSVALTAEPTALSLVEPIVRQTGALALISPNNQVIAGQTRFQIIVRASDGGAGQANIPVFVSNVFPTQPVITCLPGVTDAAGQAVLDCELGEVTAARAIQLTISDAVAAARRS